MNGFNNELITTSLVTNNLTDDDIYIVHKYDGILVYIMAGEIFSDRVFKIFITTKKDRYFYCENNEAWHPNIEYKQINSIDQARIDTEDLGNTLDLHSTLISLKELIQNPDTNNPFNIDASISYCRDKSNFTEKHWRLKKTEYNPFNNIEYIINKV